MQTLTESNRSVRSFVVYIQPNRRSWRGYITADKKAPRDPRPVRLFLDLSAESLFTPAGGCPDGHERGEGATTLLCFFFFLFPFLLSFARGIQTYLALICTTPDAFPFSLLLFFFTASDVARPAFRGNGERQGFRGGHTLVTPVQGRVALHTERRVRGA